MTCPEGLSYSFTLSLYSIAQHVHYELAGVPIGSSVDARPSLLYSDMEYHAMSSYFSIVCVQSRVMFQGMRIWSAP